MSSLPLITGLLKDSQEKIALNFSKKTAEIAAQELAKLNSLQFVPDNVSVITVANLCDTFFPVELTPSGNVIGQGTTSQNIHSTITAAKEVANNKGLPFVFELKLSPISKG
jgi:hypothetical protein